MKRYSATIRKKEDHSVFNVLIISAETDEHAFRKAKHLVVLNYPMGYVLLSEGDVHPLVQDEIRARRLISVRALCDLEPAFARKRFFESLVVPCGNLITLDFTGVKRDPGAELNLTAIAEVMQELPEYDYELLFENPDEPHGIKGFFEIIRNAVEDRTVRVAVGSKTCREIRDVDAEKALRDAGKDVVIARRFDTVAEKEAYLRGLHDAFGCDAYMRLDIGSDEIRDLARRIPVEDASCEMHP